MVSCQHSYQSINPHTTVPSPAYTVHLTLNTSGRPTNSKGYDMSTTTTTATASQVLMPPPSTMPIRKRETSTPSSPGDEEEEEEYRPGPSKRLAGGSGTSGRRPIAPKSSSNGGSSSRGSTKMSREALRKANHSLIERRRREKINFALGELREMVPGLGEEKGGKAGEFKLEVLERTVVHMRELKAQIAELEDRVVELGGERIKRGSVACDCSEDGDEDDTKPPPPPPAPITTTTGRSVKRKYEETSTTPPSPSSSPDRRPPQTLIKNSTTTMVITESPDPNETEIESNLPPPLTMASRSSSHSSTSSHPSITSLLNTANRPGPPQPSSRPAPPPQAANPTLYLPFPTPSPTSPFLTYPSGTSSSSTSTSMSGPVEPSPFMAPLQNFSLFGGAISLDPTVSPDVRSQLHHHHAHASGSRSPPDLSMPPPKSTRDGGNKAVPSSEEAANLLLAFSSPDTLRPVSGGTPVFAPHSHRRGALDSEDFSLDGGHAVAGTRRRESHGQWNRPVTGKTARDILRM